MVGDGSSGRGRPLFFLASHLAMAAALSISARARKPEARSANICRAFLLPCFLINARNSLRILASSSAAHSALRMASMNSSISFCVVAGICFFIVLCVC